MQTTKSNHDVDEKKPSPRMKALFERILAFSHKSLKEKRLFITESSQCE